MYATLRHMDHELEALRKTREHVAESPRSRRRRRGT